MKPWLTHALLFKAVCSRKVVLKLNNKVSLSSTAAASNQVFFQRIQTKQNQKTHHFLFEKTHQPVCVCVFRASNVKAFIRLNHCSVVVISHREQQNGLVFRWKCCVLVLQAKFSLPLLPRDDVLGNWCTRQKCSAPSKANVKTMSAPDLCLLHISTSWLREESSHSISLRKLNELRYKTGQSSVSPNVYLYSLQTKCIIYYSHGLKTVRAHVLMLIKKLVNRLTAVGNPNMDSSHVGHARCVQTSYNPARKSGLQVSRPARNATRVKYNLLYPKYSQIFPLCTTQSKAFTTTN